MQKTRQLQRALLALACSASLGVMAQTAPVKNINVPPGDLAQALETLRKQTGGQILYRGDQMRGVRTQGAQGTLTAEEALERLLEGSGFEVRKDPSGAVLIKKNESVPNSAKRLEKSSYVVPKSEDKAVTELDRVVVAGSRLTRIEAEGASPIVVFDRQRIDSLGASSVPDVLNYLPQQPFTYVDGNRAVGGARFAELRGLTADMTLVLINGRRAVPSGPVVQFNAFDLNAIPLAAVERIEVLSDSASAVYGADAIGGVVNVVLKKDIPQPIVDLRYGSASGGGSERRISLSAGYSNERLHASVLLDYFKRNALLGESRDMYSNRDFRRFGGADRRSRNAIPGNICSLDGTNLPGISAPCAAVPLDSTGIDMTPEDFAETAGQVNLESARFQSIIPEADRRSAAIFAELEISPILTGFGEVLYVNRKSITHGGPPPLSGVRVPKENPFNPFGVDVAASLLVNGVGSRRGVSEGESYRIAAGMRGLINSWEWEVSLLKSDEDGADWTENSLDPVRVTAALNTSDPSGALNVFSAGPAGSSFLLASLVANPDIDNQSSQGTQATAFVRGSPFTLPAGDVQAVLGTEWREEKALFNFGSAATSSGRRVSAAFVELSLPLINPEMQVPLVRKLTFTAAGRYDRYSDFGDSINPQYGLIWQPTSDLLLRASYGTAFRAPALFELYNPVSEFPGITVTDHLRNNETASVIQSFGGDPDLKPMKADSLTTGFVWTPSQWKGLRVAASYWRINMDNRVSAFSAQQIVDNETLFPTLVVRTDPTPADSAENLPGRIINVRTILTNFGVLETSGVDFSFSHSINTKIGKFSPALSATWIERYTDETLPGIPIVDRVGVAYTFGSIPEWRGVASLAWVRRGMAISLTARYTPTYEDADLFGEATGRTLPSQTLVDMQWSIDFGEFMEHERSWLRGLKLAVGASNMFDGEPAFAEIGGTRGYDASQADPRGRFIYISASKTF